MIIDAHMHVWPDHIADAMQSQRPSGMPLAVRRQALRAAAGPWTSPGSTRGSPSASASRRRRWRGPTSSSAPCRATASCPFGHRAPRPAGRGEHQVPAGQRHRRRQAAPAVPGPVAVRPAGARHPAPRSPRKACRSSPTSAPAATRRPTSAAPRALRAAGRRPAGPEAHRLPLRRLPPPGRGRGARRRVARSPSRPRGPRPWPSSSRSGWSRLIRRHGADRVVFGSDWPMADPAAEIAAIRDLGLTPEEEAGILGGNLAEDPRHRMSDRHRPTRVVRLGAGHGLLGRPRPARDRDGRARRHRLPVLRPPGRAHHVDPRQAARARTATAATPATSSTCCAAPCPTTVAQGRSRSSATPAAPTPARPRRRVAELAKELGLSGVRIAVVTGDDIEADIDDLMDAGRQLRQPRHRRRSWSTVRERLTHAAVYTGCEGIVEALRLGRRRSSSAAGSPTSRSTSAR